MISAFNGRTEVAAGLAARINQYAEADRVTSGSLAWTGDKGSLVGCLLESDDMTRWESELGLPQWLALVVDLLAERAGKQGVADFNRQLLEAIRPGAVLETAGSCFILRLLADLEGQIPAPAGPVAEALAEVVRLHRAVIAHDNPSPAAWRAARRAATAATDEAKDELVKALATCVETAAWNPLTSRAVVYDTLRQWARASGPLSAAAIGWRTDYEPTIRARLKEMFDTHLAGKPELQKTLTVFQLLAEHYPDDERLIREKAIAERGADAQWYARAPAILFAALQET